VKRLVKALALAAFIGTPALAADMPVKAPLFAPVASWTGFYGGIQVGGAWSDKAVNYSPNDPLSALLVNGIPAVPIQPLPNDYRIRQGGITGGFEAGYNWQQSNLLFGVEADFSFAGLSGKASGTSNFGPDLIQTTTAEQRTDWYGTIRGRVGWLATPNLLLFGTGGLAYGRTTQSANDALAGLSTFFPNFSASGGFSFVCTASGVPCFAGGSSAIKAGWTAGGGAEWLFDPHWSAKIEYQLVDLGSETSRISAVTPCTTASPCGFAAAPSSLNVTFHDVFSVVRLGLNYHF
jgi:outer membrane immunogenic protein